MAQNSEGSQESLLHRDQFEYAWRWFELHARQRVTMFNFFLLATGALANAYGLLLRGQLFWQAAAVTGIGIFVSGIAFLLDVRNSFLVDIGENALKRAERTYLATESTGSDIENASQIEYAILSREKKRPYWQKHGFLIRFLEALAGTAFVVATVHSVIAAMDC